MTDNDHMNSIEAPFQDLRDRIGLRLRGKQPWIWGGMLVLVGILLLINNLGLLPFRLEVIWRTVNAIFWPLVLIGLGVLLVYLLRGGSLNLNRLRDLGERLPLRRSSTDRMLAGVCGGIGHSLRVDPLLVRIAWVLLSVLLLGVVGVVLYIAAALFIPVET
jgi:phage shock protein C